MRNILFLLSLLYMGITCNGQEPEYDLYGGYTAVKGQKTGWFHVEKLNDRWFFVTPEGNAFFSLGATHAVETIKQDELNVFQSKYYGDEKLLSQFFVDCFKDWGYNSSGYGPLPSMEKVLPYVATIRTDGPRSFSAGEASQNSDIFNPEVRTLLIKKIKEIADLHKNNPMCLGYVFVDLPVWGVVPQRGISYVDYFRSLDATAFGKKEYVEFLRLKYNNTIQSLNKAYSAEYKSFEELISGDISKLSAINNTQIAADDEDFLVVIAESYYQCIVPELRKADPNHLILGDRFMAATMQQTGLRVPDAVLEVASKFVDVLSFQPMGATIMWKEYLDHVSELTGKPLLFADTNTMPSRPLEGQTDTFEYEKTAGENTYNYYLNAISNHSLIGIHRCTVRDYRPWDTRFHRRGLLKADDSPYPVLVDYTKKTNQKVYEIVYGSKN